MKRLAVGPIIVVVSMLVIVAPASATTVLHGKFAGGNVQSPDSPQPPDPPGGPCGERPGEHRRRRAPGSRR